MSQQRPTAARPHLPAWFPRGITLLQDPTLNKGKRTWRKAASIPVANVREVSAHGPSSR